MTHVQMESIVREFEQRKAKLERRIGYCLESLAELPPGPEAASDRQFLLDQIENFKADNWLTDEWIAKVRLDVSREQRDRIVMHLSELSAISKQASDPATALKAALQIEISECMLERLQCPEKPKPPFRIGFPEMELGQLGPRRRMDCDVPQIGWTFATALDTRNRLDASIKAYQDMLHGQSTEIDVPANPDHHLGLCVPAMDRHVFDLDERQEISRHVIAAELKILERQRQRCEDWISDRTPGTAPA